MQKRLNIENAQVAMNAKGLSQTDLANNLEVSREAISQWFREKTFPRPNKLLQLGKLLELSFDALVMKDSGSTPIVAFRKMKGTRTKNHHIESAEEKGRFLSHLVPFLPFDTLEMPPILKAPCCDYDYLQQVAQKVRVDINVDPTEIIDFTHLIRRFSELQAVLIPVLWGSKQRHENAIHIYLPDSQTTWVYLNLDVNVHDFKFWMAHELGHCLSPSLTGADLAEDFADAFAGALLFPAEKAQKAYTSIAAKRSVRTKIECLLNMGEQEIISPYTIYLQANKYAEHAGKPLLSMGNKFYAAITEFNKKYSNFSEILFDDVENITPTAYIRKTSDFFGTPFFDVLGNYLRDSSKGSGVVHAVTDMPLLDARSLHAELT